VVRATRLFISDGETRRALSRSGLRAFPRRLGILSFGLFGGILVLTAGVFFVLPRTARAAFQRFVPERYHLPGFSNEVTLGEIGEIKQSSAPVMHVYSQGDGFLAVRWRGAALTHFDGKRWFNLPAAEERLRPEGRRVLLLEGPPRPGRRIEYEVRLSDIASNVLFVAGTPESMIIDVPVVSRSSSGTLHVSRPNGAGLRYAVSSLLDQETSTAAQLSPAARVEALALPPLDERIPQLALDMTAGLATPDEKARVLERRLRHDYGYTLELLPAPVADPLATFLFARKKGHCEYFASAMAVMLRTQGIPARVVTGFLGGVYNPMTGWQVVRASDAHSWVEAWLPRRGWVTFDPTPPDPSPASSASLWTRAGLVLDAADQFWQDWVVGYDFERQITLASRMQESGRSFRFPWWGETAAQMEKSVRAARAYAVEALGLFALAALAIIYGPTLLRKLRADLRVRRAQRGEAQASDATLLYERMLRVLERRGLQKPPWLTPAEFARVLPASELAMLVEDLTGAYNQFRFGGRRDAAPRMVRLLRRIETLESH
jgi:protein-glutamine gamma-glutamyltransferase